ncbi:tetratricopeptide repeat protein [Prosthecobacter dejongeii]|uniref:Tetratricopeptide (TPR) repeat protein n=1 Tax=Prosthecobacter dejongeii TaxID=48465 RepID=A0A7W8DPD2_9BACT|nr:tetratricopeptide repeat protein [Prosthecobacter dejongeii]MBB5037534.1 tetratricopeptide (TPR) repeat protein [Prosthecobacter dejongeii]
MNEPPYPTSLVLLASVTAVGLITWSIMNPVAPAKVAGDQPAPAVAMEAKTVMEMLAPAGPKSKTDRLLVEAEQMTLKRPQQAASWIQLGDALVQKQRETQAPVWYAQAEKAYQKAWQIEPQNTEALNGLAWVYGGRHDFKESVRWAKLALEVDPTHPISHGIIGDAAVELGDFERAYESYQAMMDARPDLSAYSRGAYLVWLSGDSRKARWLMQQAIDAGGPHAENTAWCHTRLAMMLFHEGALLPAAQAVEKALRETPDHAPLLLMQGKIKVAMDDEAGATAAYQAVLTQEENHEALVGMGDLHLLRGRKQEAEAFFQRVEKLHLSNAKQGIHDHTQMARFYADHDRELEKALTFAEEHAQTQNVYEADTLAWALYHKGEFLRARKVIEIALRAGTPDAEIYYHAGLIATALKDRPGAKKLLARALSLNPRFHPLHSGKAVKALDELAQPLATTE